MPPRVLIVEDDRLMREMLADPLRAEGMAVVTATGGEEALTILAREPADVVVADLVMPGMGGLDVLERLTWLQPRPEVVVVTGYGTVESAVRALRLGAFEYLQKPVTPEMLVRTVRRSIDFGRLRDSDDEVAAALRLHERCRRIADTADRARVFEQATRALAQITRAGGGLGLLWEWGKADLQIMARCGLEEAVASGLARRVEEAVVHEGPERPCLVSIPDEGVALVAPLSRGEQVAGALVAVHPPADGFDARSLRAAAYLADHTCYALDRAGTAAVSIEEACLDELTGLYNASYFDALLARAIASAEAAGAEGADRRFSLLLLDVDGLRDVNDRFGHVVGSKVLVELGRVLKRCVREIDPVFRYGGDEYTLLLPGVDSQSARQVAERIRRSVEHHPFLSREGLDVRVTASVGVATYPEHAVTKERLLDRADAALLKGKGRNTVIVADHG